MNITTISNTGLTAKYKDCELPVFKVEIFKRRRGIKVFYYTQLPHIADEGSPAECQEVQWSNGEFIFLNKNITTKTEKAIANAAPLMKRLLDAGYNINSKDEIITQQGTPVTFQGKPLYYSFKYNGVEEHISYYENGMHIDLNEEQVRQLIDRNPAGISLVSSDIEYSGYEVKVAPTYQDNTYIILGKNGYQAKFNGCALFYFDGNEQYKGVYSLENGEKVKLDAEQLKQLEMQDIIDERFAGFEDIEGVQEESLDPPSFEEPYYTTTKDGLIIFVEPTQYDNISIILHPHTRERVAVDGETIYYYNGERGAGIYYSCNGENQLLSIDQIQELRRLGFIDNEFTGFEYPDPSTVVNCRHLAGSAWQGTVRDSAILV